MKVTVKSTSEMNVVVNKFLESIKQQIPQKVFEGAKHGFIASVKPSIPIVTGSFQASFKYNNSIGYNGLNKYVPIITINKGIAADLLENGDNIATLNKYKYGKEGRFIPFRASPDLEKWAKIKFKNYTPRMKGLRVGKHSTTHWGRPHNKWFTNSGTRFKHYGYDYIIRQLRTIKMKK